MTIFNPVSLAIKITPKPRGEGFNIDLKDPDGSTIREELELTALKAKLGELQALCVSHKPEEYGRILFKYLPVSLFL